MYKKVLASIYKIIINKRNKKYDSNPDKLVRLKTPIISIGNLNVGGTGKTPFVQMLTWLLQSNGIKPAIIGLGYKRKSKGIVVACDGESILADAKTAGDEMYLLADSLNVPVVVSEKKYKAAQYAENKFRPDVIIIDDGYQHRHLHRDIDILLVDKDTMRNPELLPLGRLREPLNSVNRADVVCYTNGAYPSKEFAEHLNAGTISISTEVSSGKPLDLVSKRYLSQKQVDFYKRRVFIISGIAKPERFYHLLKSNRWFIANYKYFPDHHNYSKKDIENVIKLAKASNCKAIITTEKDAVKLKEFSKIFAENNVICIVYPIRLKIIKGFPYFKTLINKVLKKDLQWNIYIIW